jgi:hypothetical protein
MSGATVIQCRLPNCCSIFTAELRAILLCIDFIYGCDRESFLILSDSLSALQALKSCNFDNFLVQQIAEKCHFLHEIGKNIVFCWVPSHIGISGNEKADLAAKAALSFPVLDFKIPYTDTKPVVGAYCSKLWSNHWNTITFNKLKGIKPNLGPTILKNIRKRKDETVLHRIRIGHTHLTHSYLLKKEDQPQCLTCNCALTVEHILLTCPLFSVSRNKYLTANSMLEIFQNIPVYSILNFLKECQLFTKL